MLGVISQVIMKYVTKWKEFLETPYAEKNVPNQHDKLQSAQNYSDDDTIAEETTQELPANEEWMLLSDLTPRSLIQLINHNKLLTCIITANQMDLNIKKFK